MDDQRFKLTDMKLNLKMLYLIVSAGLLFSSCKSRETPVDLVNPFIDTHNSRWFYFNSASRPFGMVNLSPDTDTDKTWSSGYLYDTDTIRCFSHVHAWQLAGIAVMPSNGEFKGHLGIKWFWMHTVLKQN